MIDSTLDTLYLSVDLETYGLSATAVVLSIGACVIPSTPLGEIPTADQFYREIDNGRDSQPGRTIDPSTLEWWKEEQAKGSCCPLNGTSPLVSILAEFNLWIEIQKKARGVEKISLWANGTDFDIAILYHAMRQFGIRPAWKYNEVRDLRTLRSIFPSIPAPTPNTMRHNAVYDALYQARHVAELLDYVELLQIVSFYTQSRNGV